MAAWQRVVDNLVMGAVIDGGSEEVRESPAEAGLLTAAQVRERHGPGHNQSEQRSYNWVPPVIHGSGVILDWARWCFTVEE
jgi:hypothetical protein